MLENRFYLKFFKVVKKRNNFIKNKDYPLKLTK